MSRDCENNEDDFKRGFTADEILHELIHTELHRANTPRGGSVLFFLLQSCIGHSEKKAKVVTPSVCLAAPNDGTISGLHSYT